MQPCVYLVTKETQGHPGCLQWAWNIRSGRVWSTKSSPGEGCLYFWHLEREAPSDSGYRDGVGPWGGWRCLYSSITTLPPHRLIIKPLPSKSLLNYLYLTYVIQNVTWRGVSCCKYIKNAFPFLLWTNAILLYFYHKFCGYSLYSFQFFLLTFIYRWEILKAFSFSEYKNWSVTEILRRANYVYHTPLPSTLFVITELELNKRLR